MPRPKPLSRPSAFSGALDAIWLGSDCGKGHNSCFVFNWDAPGFDESQPHLFAGCRRAGSGSAIDAGARAGHGRGAVLGEGLRGYDHARDCRRRGYPAGVAVLPRGEHGRAAVSAVCVVDGAAAGRCRAGGGSTGRLARPAADADRGASDDAVEASGAPCDHADRVAGIVEAASRRSAGAAEAVRQPRARGDSGGAGGGKDPQGHTVEVPVPGAFEHAELGGGVVPAGSRARGGRVGGAVLADLPGRGAGGRGGGGGGVAESGEPAEGRGAQGAAGREGATAVDLGAAAGRGGGFICAQGVQRHQHAGDRGGAGDPEGVAVLSHREQGGAVVRDLEIVVGADPERCGGGAPGGAGAAGADRGTNRGARGKPAAGSGAASGGGGGDAPVVGGAAGAGAAAAGCLREPGAVGVAGGAGGGAAAGGHSCEVSVSEPAGADEPCRDMVSAERAVIGAGLGRAAGGDFPHRRCRPPRRLIGSGRERPGGLGCHFFSAVKVPFPNCPYSAVPLILVAPSRAPLNVTLPAGPPSNDHSTWSPFTVPLTFAWPSTPE